MTNIMINKMIKIMNYLMTDIMMIHFMIHLMINIMIHRMIHIMIKIMIYLMTYIMTNIMTNIMINVMTAWKKVHSHSGQLSFFPHHFLNSEPSNKHVHKEFGYIFLSMSFSRNGSEAICTLYIYDREGVAVAVAA